MRNSSAILVLSLAAAFAGTAHAVPITYSLDAVTVSDAVNLTDYVVTGTITTNGALGAISAGDITSWSWSATNGIEVVDESSASGGGVQVFLPLGITATLDELSAAFVSPAQHGQGLAGGGIEFQSPDGSSLTYLANQAELPAPDLLGYKRETDVVLKGSKIAQNFVFAGTGPTVPPPFVFATATPVPVPASLPLLGSALLGFSGLGYRRRPHGA